MEFHRNIFRNYPVGRLPSDLRDGFEEDARVELTIEDAIDLLPNMLVIEKLFAFRDGVVVMVGERSYKAS